MFTKLKAKAYKLKNEFYALYLCYKDKRTPWYAKIVIIFTLGYALSPIDLIPDFIPVIGYLDDLIIVPLGIKLSIKLIPPNILEENREKAANLSHRKLNKNYAAGIIFILIWIIILLLLARFFYHLFAY
jgi:uncharacterized membrane protein YkvA (DUF1232 family)